MSDSGNADRPSNATISRALRDVVISVYKAGNTDDLTVKRVRSRAEVELDLPVGFFKSNQTWKKKSHDIIHEAVVGLYIHPITPCAIDTILRRSTAATSQYH